ncbi:hypothetical protein [Marinoscillum sp.]|uniref:hypothetical protein n=1 Tax=Marinoscillum sp. TaxID=2024838 RepID=UPI003BAD04A8
MTRYDFRFKRQAFRSHNIAKHKDFGSLEKLYSARKRSRNIGRLLLILIGLILLIITLLFTSAAQNLPTDQYNSTEQAFKNLPNRL